MGELEKIPSLNKTNAQKALVSAVRNTQGGTRANYKPNGRPQWWTAGKAFKLADGSEVTTKAFTNPRDLTLHAIKASLYQFYTFQSGRSDDAPQEEPEPAAKEEAVEAPPPSRVRKGPSRRKAADKVPEESKTTSARTRRDRRKISDTVPVEQPKVKQPKKKQASKKGDVPTTAEQKVKELMTAVVGLEKAQKKPEGTKLGAMRRGMGRARNRQEADETVEEDEEDDASDGEAKEADKVAQPKSDRKGGPSRSQTKVSPKEAQLNTKAKKGNQRVAPKRDYWSATPSKSLGSDEEHLTILHRVSGTEDALKKASEPKKLFRPRKIYNPLTNEQISVRRQLVLRLSMIQRQQTQIPLAIDDMMKRETSRWEKWIEDRSNDLSDEYKKIALTYPKDLLDLTVHSLVSDHGGSSENWAHATVHAKVLEAIQSAMTARGLFAMRTPRPSVDVALAELPTTPKTPAIRKRRHDIVETAVKTARRVRQRQGEEEAEIANVENFTSPSQLGGDWVNAYQLTVTKGKDPKRIYNMMQSKFREMEKQLAEIQTDMKKRGLVEE